MCTPGDVNLISIFAMFATPVLVAVDRTVVLFVLCRYDEVYQFLGDGSREMSSFEGKGSDRQMSHAQVL